MRCSSWEAYAAPMLANPRLTVLAGALVTRLLFAGSVCRGVALVRDGLGFEVEATREVVLTAGAIDTPRLLMLSGVGDADALRSLGIEPRVDLPGVGQNLQEHVIVAGLCFQARRPLGPVNNNLEGSTFFWRSRGGLRAPDLMFVSIQVPYATPELAETLSGPRRCVLYRARPDARGKPWLRPPARPLLQRAA